MSIIISNYRARRNAINTRQYERIIYLPEHIDSIPPQYCEMRLYDNEASALYRLNQTSARECLIKFIENIDMSRCSMTEKETPMRMESYLHTP